MHVHCVRNMIKIFVMQQNYSKISIFPTRGMHVDTCDKIRAGWRITHTQAQSIMSICHQSQVEERKALREVIKSNQSNQFFLMRWFQSKLTRNKGPIARIVTLVAPFLPLRHSFIHQLGSSHVILVMKSCSLDPLL